MRKCPRVTLVSILVAGAVGALALPAGAHAQSAATSPTSPVNLATPVDFAAAQASRGATVVADDDARFEVLGDGLIRMEYSPTGSFEDAPTVNALNRRFAVPRYRVSKSDGWLTITTSEATLRYHLGSGPFGPDNTSVRLASGDTVTPQWENVCPFDQVCDAGAAALSGGANIQTNHSNYQSTAGSSPASARAAVARPGRVLGAPPGQAVVTVRYANYIGALGGPAPRTIDLTVNGTDVQTLTLPPTSSWDDWNTVTATVPLTAGTNTVGLLCAPSDSCNVNVDTLSVAPTGAPAPAQPDLHYLGGYTRGFDTATYGPGYSCPRGDAYGGPVHGRAAADAPGDPRPGRLPPARRQPERGVDRRRLGGAPRPGGDVQDGYLFVYGHDYTAGARGPQPPDRPSPLLPEYTFGVWFSRYYPYSASDYENSLIPAFQANHVPLDTLSVDTDWKAPNAWDGWEWNPHLFPDPQGFLNWANSKGIHVTLNIHSSIADNDPQLAATAGSRRHSLADDTLLHPGRHVQGLGLEQRPAGRVLLRPAPAVRVTGRVVLVARLVLRRSTASIPGVTPDAGSTTCTPRRWRTRTSAVSSCPAPAAPTRTPTRSTQPVRGPATPRRSPSPATRGARGTRSPSRPSSPATRPASTSRTSATTSAASSASHPAIPRR